MWAMDYLIAWYKSMLSDNDIPGMCSEMQECNNRKYYAHALESNNHINLNGMRRSLGPRSQWTRYSPWIRTANLVSREAGRRWEDKDDLQLPRYMYICDLCILLVHEMVHTEKLCILESYWCLSAVRYMLRHKVPKQLIADFQIVKIMGPRFLESRQLPDWLYVCSCLQQEAM